MSERIRIGGWEFAPQLHELRSGATVVRLEPKHAAVLELLASRASDVVTKDDILATVWSEVHVTEEVLTNAIYTLRKVLGDDARRPRYIQTIPRRGYRLIPAETMPASRPVPPRRRMALAIAAVVAIASAAVLVSGRPDLHPEAEALTTEGWAALERRTEESELRALELFERALAIDSDRAPALAGRARGRIALVSRGALAPAIGHPLAERDALRALRVDPESIEATLALGALRIVEWEWESARRFLARAIEIDPRSADAHAMLAELRLLTGGNAEARTSISTALRLAPDSPRVLAAAGLIYTMLRDHDRARLAYQRMLEIDPDDAGARRQIEKLADRSRSRLPLERGDILRNVDAVLRKGEIRPAIVAGMFAEAGDSERALQWLERARDEKDLSLLLVRLDDRWGAMHADPRMRAILADAVR